MGRIKRYFYSFILAAVVLAMVLLGGCGSRSNTEETGSINPKTETKGQSSETEKKNTEDIPDELLPGGESTGKDQETFDASGGSEDNGTGSGQTVSGEKQKGAGKQSQEKQGISGGEQESSQIQVSVSVDSSAVGNIVSYSGSVTLDKGATAYDALAALVGNKVTGSSSYVTGIGGLSEKDYGSKSGWMYYVNGAAPNKGSSSYKLYDGDVVIWSYTK